MFIPENYNKLCKKNCSLENKFIFNAKLTIKEGNSVNMIDQAEI